MIKKINVFINGTDERADDLTAHSGFTSLANLLHALVEKGDDMNICLNGCSIDNPHRLDLGIVFTFHLEKQVNEIVQRVREEIQRHGRVHLNLYGFSRGGAAVFWICKKLKDVSKDELTINASAFEPVPGNFMRGVYIDKLSGANTTLASQISDLSDCKNISRLQVLFTCVPLADIACHGPVLPILPPDAYVEIDVTAGCHKGSELFQKWGGCVIPYNKESAIAFHQVVDFLEGGGLKFDLSQLPLIANLRDRSTANKINLFKSITVEPTRRAMHFDNEIRATAFTAREEGTYLNLYHQKLEGSSGDLSECALVLKDYSPTPTYHNCLKSFGFFKTTALVGGSVALCSASIYSKI